jgi:hypothetical protein
VFRGGLRERKSWAVLRRLGKLSGTGVIAAITWDRLPDGTTDAQRATAIAETGEYALTMIIESAGEFADQDVTRHIWKAVTPDAGAQAAVFVAHGLAATTAKLAAFPDHHLNATAHERARSLLRGSFPWSEAEERAIAELADDDGWSEARLVSWSPRCRGYLVRKLFRNCLAWRRSTPTTSRSRCLRLGTGKSVGTTLRCRTYVSLIRTASLDGRRRALRRMSRSPRARPTAPPRRCAPWDPTHGT